jgi:hypothetical protein
MDGVAEYTFYTYTYTYTYTYLLVNGLFVYLPYLFYLLQPGRCMNAYLTSILMINN